MNVIKAIANAKQKPAGSLLARLRKTPRGGSLRKKAADGLKALKKAHGRSAVGLSRLSKKLGKSHNERYTALGYGYKKQS